MLRRNRRRLLKTEEEVDPMIYAVNMVDCMLVLAVGFLVFTVMSMGMQSVVFSTASPQEKKEHDGADKGEHESNEPRETNIDVAEIDDRQTDADIHEIGAEQ